VLIALHHIGTEGEEEHISLFDFLKRFVFANFFFLNIGSQEPDPVLGSFCKLEIVTKKLSNLVHIMTQKD